MKSVFGLLEKLGFTKGSELKKLDKKMAVTGDDNFRDDTMDQVIRRFAIEECVYDFDTNLVDVGDFCSDVLSALKNKAVYFEGEDGILFFYSDTKGMNDFVEKEIKKFKEE